MTRRIFVLIGLLFGAAVPLAAQDQAEDPALWRVRFIRAAESEEVSNDAARVAERTVDGRVLVEAVDGGILLEDRAGRLWNITPERLLARERTDERFVPYSKEEMASHLQSALGVPCQVVATKHYLIATSGSRLYAEWCGALFERLLRAFVRYWQAAGLDVAAPSAPLPVIVHGNRTAYVKSARADGGVLLTDADGYYSMKSNRVVLLDRPFDRGVTMKSRAHLQRLISANPAAVSTIVHEATHQIAFNSGMHTRYADNPVWLTEGMALFFEVPDLRSASGWRTIGRINRPRLAKFRQTLDEGRAADSLTSLIADDTRFRNPETVEAAYAEAWALTHFLINHRREELVSFLKDCSVNPRLIWKSRKQRLDEFQRAFGVAPRELDEAFVRYVLQLR